MKDSEIRFFVPGKPVPGGSKRAFAHPKTGKIVVMDMGVGNKDWRASIVAVAAEAHHGPPLEGPISAEFHFVMPRPKSHYHASKKRCGELRDDAPHYHLSAPDTLKLTRAAEDALKHVLYRDDCLIATEHCTKRYGERPGVEIVIRSLNGDQPCPAT